jgi:hypothetical protein
VKRAQKLREFEENQAIGRDHAEELYLVEEEYYKSGQHCEFIEEMQAHEWAKSIDKLLHDSEPLQAGVTVSGGKPCTIHKPVRRLTMKGSGKEWTAILRIVKTLHY